MTSTCGPHHHRILEPLSVRCSLTHIIIISIVSVLAVVICCAMRYVLMSRRRRRIEEAIDAGLFVPDQVETLRRGAFAFTPARPKLWDVHLVDDTGSNEDLKDISVCNHCIFALFILLSILCLASRCYHDLPTITVATPHIPYTRPTTSRIFSFPFVANVTHSFPGTTLNSVCECVPRAHRSNPDYRIHFPTVSVIR
jgi:hypothetical protein